MNYYNTCHKCGGEGIFLDSQEVGYSADGNEMKLLDYECDQCGATWDVTYQMTPVSRENHES